MTRSDPVDYSRKWLVMAAVAMSIFLGTIDSSIVNVALPTLVRELGADFPTVQWVVLGYLLTLATLMLSMGRLGDMIGKKPVYIAGFVIFTLGSVLCGFAPTAAWLIAFRVLQAVGAAMTMSLGMAITTEAFPPAERGKALGISGSIVSIGIVTGPTLGGLIIDALSWHWIFFVNLPIGIVGTIMALRFVPARKPAGGQRFDFAGAGLLLSGLAALLLGLTVGQNMGFTDPRMLGLFAASAVLLATFVVVETRVSQPMIDFRMFGQGLFGVNLVTGFMIFVAMGGTVFLMPFYLENVLGYATRDVGLLLAVVPVALGLVAPLSGSLSDRVGSRPITTAGLAILVIGYVAVSTLTAETSGLGYVLRFLPIGLGLGVFQSPNNSAIMGAAPLNRLGVASSLLSITRVLGQIVGVSVLGALWASRVAFYSDGKLAGGATTATPGAQVAGLHETALAVVGLVTAAFLLSLWGLVRERRAAGAPAAHPAS
jgi:EmrB/QacA subfamily drug resistance transporter